MSLASIQSAEVRGDRVALVFDNGCHVNVTLDEARAASTDYVVAAAMLARLGSQHRKARR